MGQNIERCEQILVVVSGNPEGDAGFLSTLQDAGYEVAQCKDPGFACRIIESKPRGWMPNLFIVDVIIPKSSGFEIVRRIQKAYAAFNIPIAMMSPYNATEDIVEAQAAGAVGVMKKPISPAMIADVFEKERIKAMRAQIGKEVFKIDYSDG